MDDAHEEENETGNQSEFFAPTHIRTGPETQDPSLTSHQAVLRDLLPIVSSISAFRPAQIISLLLKFQRPSIGESKAFSILDNVFQQSVTVSAVLGTNDGFWQGHWTKPSAETVSDTQHKHAQTKAVKS